MPKSRVRARQTVQYPGSTSFLLFSIGLKGGHALKGVSISEFLAPSIATHYGSTSLVTFTAALIFLESTQIQVEGYATALLTIMEIPGIVVGIYLGCRHRPIKVGWSETLGEVITGKSIMLLVGGLLIGAVTSQAGYEKVAPFFIDLQGGFLALFLLHLGIFTGNLIGLSLGGTVMFGVLCASASYIAAPAAVSVALPEAKGSLALVSSIGVTFPFNLVIGIPLYLEIARLVHG